MRTRQLPDPLADLPIEPPMDGGALARASRAVQPRAANRTGKSEAAPEPLVDPEKLLLAGGHCGAPETASALAKSRAAHPLTGPAATPAAVTPAAATAAVTAPAVTAPRTAAPATTVSAVAAPTAAAATPKIVHAMDRDFIARNQVIERYLSGRLPLKGATEFEHFCEQHPELLDELGLADKINAALRLLEASGKPAPWERPQPPFWQKLEITLGLLGSTLVLGTALALVASGSIHKSHRIAALQRQVIERPLLPATSTTAIHLRPSRIGASEAPAILIGGGRQGELADFEIDESRSPYNLFRITIDRLNQGRVGVIDRITKDSNGNLRLVLNTTALGPGNYLLTIDGLTWQGNPVPDSWVTIGIRPVR